MYSYYTAILDNMHDINHHSIKDTNIKDTNIKESILTPNPDIKSGSDVIVIIHELAKGNVPIPYSLSEISLQRLFWIHEVCLSDPTFPRYYIDLIDLAIIIRYAADQPITIYK
jgi:hypothetical protein